MSMFKNYGDDSYPAYNLTPIRKIPEIQTNFKTPLYIKDKNHNINRFYWVEGEKFTLKLNLQHQVHVPQQSIIFYGNEEPNAVTVGHIGQKCYNFSKYISWTCQNITTNGYIWVQDVEFTYLPYGGDVIDVAVPMTDKTLKIVFLNFRREVIYEYTCVNNNSISITINNEDTPELRQGQYFIDVFVADSSSYFVTEYDVTILSKLSKLKYNTTTGTYYIFNNSIQTQGDVIVWEPIQKSDIQDSEWQQLNNDIYIDISSIVPNNWFTI